MAMGSFTWLELSMEKREKKIERERRESESEKVCAKKDHKRN